MKTIWDVVVVGSGNAGLCSAISAALAGGRVLVIEKAPIRYRGGNSSLTMNMRFPHVCVEDLLDLVEIEDRGIPLLKSHYTPYLPKEMYSDIMRVTQGRVDADLLTELVNNGYETVQWLRGFNHKWEVKNTILSGSLPIRLKGSGRALQCKHYSIADSLGIEIRYDTELLDIDLNRGSYLQLELKNRGVIFSKSLILACGGFQANELLRVKYLGEKWRSVALRGVHFNTGAGHEIADKHLFQPAGDYSSCHASPQCSKLSQLFPGENESSQNNSRYAFNLGITVNCNGVRFFNEHEDLPNFLYAKFGKSIVEQPGSIAYQIFDANSILKVPSGYYATENLFRSTTIEGLSASQGIPYKALKNTIKQYNSELLGGEIDTSHFKDFEKPMPILKPPFYISPVKAGITFCYGGLKIDKNANVYQKNGAVLENVFAVGELAGGLHFHNYAGGTGLLYGSHFGRIAGLNSINKLSF